MGLDNYTKVVYGWKITDKNKLKQIEDDLENWNEDYFCEDFIVDDTMCGNYIYFGAILTSYDADEGGEVIIDDELIKTKTKEWNDFLKDNTEFKNIIEKYKEGDPKLYVFQQIW